MPDFQRVSAPVFTPTRCFACLSHRDNKGFIDTLVEQLEGRLYLCVTCLEQAGRKAGMLSAEQADELTRVVQEAVAKAAALEIELSNERDNKLIDLATARELLGAA